MKDLVKICLAFVFCLSAFGQTPRSVPDFRTAPRAPTNTDLANAGDLFVNWNTQDMYVKTNGYGQVEGWHKLIFGGSGDFAGPSESTNLNLVAFDGTSGKVGTDSGLLADGTGGLTVKQLNVSGSGSPLITMTNGAWVFTLSPHASQSADFDWVFPSAPQTGLLKVTASGSTGTLGYGVPGTDFQAPLTPDASDAILVPWVSTTGTIPLTWRKAPAVEEFMGATTIFGTVGINAGGTATIPSTAPDTLEAGVASFSTAANTNSICGVGGNASAQASIVFGTNTIAVVWRMRTPAALSSDTDVYALVAGFGDRNDQTSPEPSDGAYLFYTHGTSNGVWTAKTASNGSATFATGASSTVTVAVDTWYNLKVEGNKDAVDFWVSANDGATWTYVGRSTSNIPTTLVRAFGVQAYIRKMAGSTGTTARVMHLGRFAFWPNRVN